MLRSHKVWVLGLFGILIIGAAILWFKGYLGFDYIKANYEQARVLNQLYPGWFEIAFIAILTVLTAISLPGASFCSVLAGALFGMLPGSLIVAGATTLGATLAFMLARYVLRDSFEDKYGEKVRVFNQHMHRDGAYYLFALRLNPIVPFFLINVVMGLTPMSLWTYSWVSFVGMVPGTLLYVNAGTQLAKISSPWEVLSPVVLLSLLLLAVFPLAAKKIFSKTTR